MSVPVAREASLTMRSCSISKLDSTVSDWLNACLLNEACLVTLMALTASAFAFALAWTKAVCLLLMWYRAEITDDSLFCMQFTATLGPTGIEFAIQKGSPPFEIVM